MNRRSFIKNAAATGAVTVGLTEFGSSILARIFGRAATNTATAQPLRPPGALMEEEFLSTCIRCQRCGDACPNHAIEPLDDTFGAHKRITPFIKPRKQACMLCNGVEGEYLKCTEACPTGALQLIRKAGSECRWRGTLPP